MRRPSARLRLARLFLRAEARRAARAAGLGVAALSLAAAAGAQGPVPQGAQFRVNTYTIDIQRSAAVAADADGDFVVAWESRLQDGSAYGIYAQRYDAAGTPQGAEFRVNTYTTSNERAPSVAMDADGDFVVAWQSQLQEGPGAGDGVYAQRFSAAGAPQGAELHVNTYTIGAQRAPAVAMDADGDFAVVWESQIQDGSSYGVYAQRYSAAGTPQGAEFRANTHTTDFQQNPAVAMDAGGAFVVVWQSGLSSGAGQDGSLLGVYGQRYDAAGAAQGAEFQANTYTTGDQRNPAVATDADGDFVVAWESFGQDGGYGNAGVYARRYAAAGTPLGAEVRANTFTTDRQQNASVGMDADGDFVVAWMSFGQDAYTFGVFAQAYTAAGAPAGGEFRVNTASTGEESYPAVGVAADGDIVVAWEDFTVADGSGPAVFAQRYGPAPVAAEPGAPASLGLALAPSPVGAGGGRLRYALAAGRHVRLAVYDALGREVAVLADGARPAGAHEVRLDAGRLAPGAYVARLVAGDARQALRFTVLR